MWALITNNNIYYPEQIYLYSKDRAALEEIALSLYEEDAYEWFCVFNNSDYYKKDAVKIAHERALYYNKFLDIVKLKIICYNYYRK